MLRCSALVALVLASASSAALAQENFGAKPSDSLGIYSSYNQNLLLRQSMNDDAKTAVTPEQRRRAEKAVALIKANRCADAYTMALDEQDTRLAGNIAVACKAHFRQ